MSRKNIWKDWATSCVAAAVILAACGKIAAGHASRQSTNSSSAAIPSFEVVSIKPSRSDKADIAMNWGADRCSIANVTARRLIAMAYGVSENDQVSGAPAWTNSDRYDLDAKIEDSLTEKMQRLPIDQQGEQLKRMLQSLLADRFQLRVSHGTKDLPVFALVVAKNGPKLTPTILPPDDPANARNRTPRNMRTPAKGQLIAKGQPIVALLGILSRELGGRIVLDETGLKGEYDFKLQWTPESSVPIGGSDGPQSSAAAVTDSAAPSIFTALQEQLGLKLEPRKAPKDVIVVAHIERRSEN